jgi:hypothetical protein
MTDRNKSYSPAALQSCSSSRRRRSDLHASAMAARRMRLLLGKSPTHRGRHRGFAPVFQVEWHAVNGPLILYDVEILVRAAIDGVGLAFVSDDSVAQHLASGALVHVLENRGRRSPASSPTTRVAGNKPAALSALINTLRLQEPSRRPPANGRVPNRFGPAPFDDHEKKVFVAADWCSSMAFNGCRHRPGKAFLWLLHAISSARPHPCAGFSSAETRCGMLPCEQSLKGTVTTKQR